MSTRLAYRPEIDGLRSIAVIPVILFHAGFTVFSGGYIGVDVFFVISGYLITGILLREIAEQNFSILRFYERRARRILPALFVVMLTSLPFAWAWMTAPLYADFSKSLLAVLGFVSNILFWQQSSYFDVSAEFKPMLHTWSLAIEEQYYIFFPPLLWGAMRLLKVRGSLIVFAALTAVSLTLTEMMVRGHPIGVFYLLPFRAWELLTGALCAFAHLHGRRHENQSLVVVGIVLILGSIVFLDASTPFPSLFALAPVIGAALVVLFGSATGLSGALLANPVAVWVGLVSYSAYLWHQPLFALARLRFDLASGTPIFLALSGASLALAWASWRYVERPFRRQLPLKPFIAFTVSTALALSMVGTLGTIEYNMGRSRLAPILYTDALINTEQERALTWSTVLENPDLAQALTHFPKDAAQRILLVGDSHAKDLFNALYLTDGPENISVRRVTMGGACTYRVNARFEPTTPEQCFRQLVKRAGPLLKEADAVLLTKRWVLEDGTFSVYLPVFIARLKTMGKTVAIAGNTVEYAPEPPMLLRRMAKHGALDTEDVAHRLWAARRPQVFETNARLAEVAQNAGIPYLDKTPLLCDISEMACPALTEDGHAIYTDYGHLSLQGAMAIGRQIRETEWLGPLWATRKEGAP
ncbi:peptidoglycan/LPS O-acetylase OafA/YrhL [Rhodobacter sp. JA431]|uniref:acyltransferase family protein n=1 Tax=Rhodobacter sp. JA431 TaxID=570013 RepID=UPI000BCAA734|nr:acyltransferase family protein [Rhodobacter sp. JA431]SOB99916.1 peptidoglycan/LPS O-acetylase OafA/YrhL [Rhodobacter sp. JA431]